jgi:hypothetical protein
MFLFTISPPLAGGRYQGRVRCRKPKRGDALEAARSGSGPRAVVIGQASLGGARNVLGTSIQSATAIGENRSEKDDAHHPRSVRAPHLGRCPMQSIALVSTREAPRRIRMTKHAQIGSPTLASCTVHAGTPGADAGLLSVHPEPDRGTDVGLDLRTGRVVRQGRGPRVGRVRVERWAVSGGQWRTRTEWDGGTGTGT